jgi:hypothetical protein
MVTVVTDEGEAALAGAEPARGQLWLSAADAASATGWTLKPEGLCRDDRCVPLPPGRERELARDGRIDAAALWRRLGRPVVHSDRGDVWVLGRSAEDRAADLRSLEAPDVTLPDPSGRPHSLSDHRGKKVLLVTWASW